MRIRQIKPAYWLDKELRQRLTAAEREFYIGLWMLADDAGFLELEVERIAAELYPYDGTRRRERFVAAAIDKLATLAPDNAHLVRYPCGHGLIPKLSQHQRIAGKQSFTVRDRHQSERRVSSREPIPATDSLGRVMVGNGTVGNGRVINAPAGADSQDETTPFGEAMAAHGLKPAIAKVAS